MVTEKPEETAPHSEEKKADETEGDKTEETSEETEETKGTEKPEGSGDEKEEASSQDWKKIAQHERDAREKAEKALARDRYQAKRKQDEEAEDAEEVGEEQPTGLTEEQLRKILREEREATRKEVLAERTQEIARKLADSDDEAEAIVEIFNNRIFPESLTHEQKVTEAFYIAHGPRLTAKILELRRSLRSKETKGKSGSENVHRDAPKADEPKLSPQDKAEMQRLGFSWNGKIYTKKTAGGKVIGYDPNTKKTFPVQGK